MIRRLTASALLALLFAAVPAARADIVFSNFGAGFAYNTSAGNFIGDGLDGSGSNYAEGDTFTSSAAYTFTSLEIALSNYYGTNTDELQVSLAADSGLGTPGAVLASFYVAPGTLGMFGNSNTPVTFAAPAGITLAASAQYWVTVADISGGSDTNVWNWNITGDSSPQAISTDGGMTWFSPSGLPAGAYQVDGSAVPEPSSLHLLLTSGALGLLRSRWRRLRQRPGRSAKSRPQAEQLEGRVVLSTSISWTAVPFDSGVGNGTMLQYPNGTIMMAAELVYTGSGYNYAGGVSNLWSVLGPSSTGSYANLNVAPDLYLMNDSRLYFATNVLPSGNIFLLGGEYSGSSGAQNEANTGEMFTGPDNFSSGTGFTPIASFPQPTFGDNPSVLLNNGLILLGTGSVQGIPYTASGLTYLYNPTSSAITAMVNGSSQSIAPGAYSAGIPTALNESNSEESFVKLPDGDVVSYNLWYSNYLTGYPGGFADLFNPTTGSWQDISPALDDAKGSIPPLSLPTDPISGNQWDELGPTLLLPNGNVFFIGGGTSNTALYNQTTNTWSSGPQIPYPYTADDAPAAVLPDGDVIFTADAALANGQYTGPTAFFDYSPGAGTITQLIGSNAPSDPGLQAGSFFDRMLVLPTGQLMFSDSASDELWLGTPSGAPLPQWRPVVTGITGSGSVYTLAGLRLNGMDAGAAYGDDAEMDENYPIVRLTNGAGTVYYATTSNWSNLGVATGNASETVTFALPSGMPAGNYSLVVSGAGISSFPVAFHVSASSTPGIAGGVVPAPHTPGTEGLIAPPNLLAGAGVTTGPAAGLQALPPLLDDFSDGNPGVFPNGFTLDDLVTATGYAPVGFTNAVDALLASEELGWINIAAFRVKHRISAGL